LPERKIKKVIKKLKKTLTFKIEKNKLPRGWTSGMLSNGPERYKQKTSGRTLERRWTTHTKTKQ
jgi:hypothetical protein